MIDMLVLWTDLGWTTLETRRRQSRHRGPTQAANLVVCSKYKEMYGKILKSLAIVKLYRGISKLKVEINVNLPQLLCIQQLR